MTGLDKLVVLEAKLPHSKVVLVTDRKGQIIVDGLSTHQYEGFMKQRYDCSHLPHVDYR